MTTEIKGGLLAQGSDAIVALKRARDRVSRAWRKGGGERYGDPDEPCQCAQGALRAETDQGLGFAGELFYRAVGLLREAIPQEASITKWNDAPGRTQAEVLAAFDRAIALAEGNAPQAPPGPAAAAP